MRTSRVRGWLRFRRHLRARLCDASRTIFATAIILISSSAVAELDLHNAAVDRLDNGLTVILLEDRNFPVASVQMLYRVGARDEVTGKTGLAHFVEHMAFRESENFPDTDVVSSIYARGGEWHGYTWTDQTTYFATVPSEHLDLLLRIEADRMSRLEIAEEKIEPERGAVLAEMHMYENDPSSMLTDAVMFASFLAHPYRNNTIGWESDIENVEHADVVDFYKKHYHPANGVLVVVGNIDSEMTLSRINELFGSFPRKAPTALPITIEPVQKGERRIELHGNGDARQFMIAYRAPSANSPDFAAFLVLQELLGAGSGVSFKQNDWGTSVREDSLLAGAADNLSTWYPPSAQDYAFVIGGSAKPGVSESDTEQEIEKRVAMARNNPVHSSTLAAAIARTQDELVFDIETTEDAAHQLAFFEGLHALDMFLTLSERINAVTAFDVQRVAETWLKPERRTFAWHLPGSPMPESSVEEVAASDKSFETSSPNQAVDREPLAVPVSRHLSGGIPVIVQQSDLSTSFHLQVILQGNIIEAAKASANSPGRGYASLTFRRRSHDVDAAIKEARATLDDASLVSSDSELRSADPETRLEQTFDQHTAIPQAAEIAPALIVITGDVDAEQIFASLEQGFGQLEPNAISILQADKIGGGELTVELGQPVAQARLGYIVSAPGPEEENYDAFRILRYILSHGYEGRLGKEAITKRGLAYYIDSRYRSDGINGWVTLGIGVDPEKVDALKELMQSELLRLKDEPPTLAEFEEAKVYFRGRAKSTAQSNRELAAALGRQWLWHGDTLISESLERRLEAVSHDDVLNIVSDFVDGLTIVVAE